MQLYLNGTKAAEMVETTGWRMKGENGREHLWHLWRWDTALHATHSCSRVATLKHLRLPTARLAAFLFCHFPIYQGTIKWQMLPFFWRTMPTTANIIGSFDTNWYWCIFNQLGLLSSPQLRASETVLWEKLNEIWYVSFRRFWTLFWTSLTRPVLPHQCARKYYIL